MINLRKWHVLLLIIASLFYVDLPASGQVVQFQPINLYPLGIERPLLLSDEDFAKVSINGLSFQKNSDGTYSLTTDGKTINGYISGNGNDKYFYFSPKQNKFSGILKDNTGKNLGYVGIIPPYKPTWDLGFNTSIIARPGGIVKIPYSGIFERQGIEFLFNGKPTDYRLDETNKQLIVTLPPNTKPGNYTFVDKDTGNSINVRVISEEKFTILLSTGSKIKEMSDILKEFSKIPNISLLNDIVIEENAVKLDGMGGKVCGRFITRLLNVSRDQLNYFGNSAQVVTGYGVNPMPSTFPNVDSGFIDYYPDIKIIGNDKKVNTNLTEKQTIKWGDSYDKYDASNSIVHVLDTASNITDNFQISTMEWTDISLPSVSYTNLGHGSIIAELIKYMNTTIKIDLMRVCNRVYCAPQDLIAAVCSIQQAAKRNPKEHHVINLSLGGPDSNGSPLFTEALIDASKSGVATVISAGNIETCKYIAREYVKGTSCFQYPVDSLADPETARRWSGVYAVGSSFQGVSTKFNRDQYTGAKPSTIKSPDVYAPGVFYSKGNSQDSREYQLRAGSSFSTAIVSAAIALWKDCHPNQIGPPLSSLWDRSKNNPILDMRYLMQGCPFKPIRTIH